MYFFLSLLSTSETCYTFVILPKMLINLFSVARTISFNCCAIQMFFFLGFAMTNCLLLGVMGYDRYAAICHPLHYPILMSWQVCGKLGAALQGREDPGGFCLKEQGRNEAAWTFLPSRAQS